MTVYENVQRAYGAELEITMVTEISWLVVTEIAWLGKSDYRMVMVMRDSL